MKSKYLNSDGTVTTRELERSANGQYKRVRVQLDPEEDATAGCSGEVIYVALENLRVFSQVDPALDVDALKSLPGPMMDVAADSTQCIACCLLLPQRQQVRPRMSEHHLG